MADNWQLKAILSAVDNMSPALKAVAATAKTTRKYLSDVGTAAAKMAGHVAMPLGLVSTTLAGFSIAGVKNAVTGFTNLAESLHASALRTGMTVEQLQRMKYVADQAGVPIEMLEGGISKLNKNIGAAAAGKGKDLAALFKKLGIDTRDSNKQLRSGMDMLPELADAFQRNTNPVTRARMGMALFGKTWKDMIPLLAEGSQALGKSGERFRLLKGVGIDEKTIEGAREFGKQIKDLNVVTTGFQNTIAAALVPVLGTVVKSFTEWAIINRKDVATNISKFVKGIVESLKEYDWKGLIASIKSFGEAIAWIVGMIGGWKTALIALVVYMNAGALVSLWQLGGAVLRLASFLGGPLITALRLVFATMMANPILLIIAAVVLLAAIICENWDAIVAYIQSAWDRVKAIFTVNFFDGIIQVYLEAWQGLANGIIGIIKTILPDKLMPEAFKNFNFSFASDRAARLINGDRPSIVGASQVNASGKIDINFNGVPPGTQIDQTTRGNIPIETDVGTRGYASDYMGYGA